MSWKPMVRIWGVLCLLGWNAVFASPTNETEFEKGMEEIAQLLLDSKWKPARADLLQLLEQHSERPYVMDRLLEIQEDFRRCSLRLAVPAPHPRELISGDLQKYLRVGGDIRIVYDTSALNDFQFTDGAYEHPLSFVGPYTIRVEGDAYPRKFENHPQICVCTSAESCFTSHFGSPVVYATLSEVTQAGSQLRAQSGKQLPKSGKKYSLEVQVNKDNVTMKFNRRTVIKFSHKNEGQYGSFALFNVSGAEKITVSGKAHTAWFHGLVDAAVRERETEWLDSHDPLEGLPDWAREAPPSNGEATPKNENQFLPWRMTESQISVFEGISAQLVNSELEAAIKALNKNSRKLPRLPSLYLSFLLFIKLGRWEKALTVGAELHAATPRSPDASRLYADLLINSGDYDQARKIAFELLEQDQATHDLIVRLDLLENQADRAREFLKTYRRSIDAKRFRDIELALIKAERGPVFERSFEEERDHYILVSDIDARVTRRAASIMENQRRLLDQYFGAPSKKGPKAQVFLFSGEARYQSYAQTVFATQGHSTAGLYSPTLKQLLVWNLSDPDAIEATLRHEGIHQYLDLRGAHVPIWINEGFAEYGSDLQEGKRGQQSFGNVSRSRILQLRQIKSLIPLEQFVGLNRERFYMQSGLTYPMAWGLVHFLHHGPDRWRPVKERAIELIRKGCTKSEFMAEVFQGVDYAAMDKDYTQYLEEIRRRG